MSAQMIIPMKEELAKDLHKAGNMKLGRFPRFPTQPDFTLVLGLSCYLISFRIRPWWEIDMSNHRIKSLVRLFALL